MLQAILTLFAMQLLGELIAAWWSLPVPGMVIGLMLLFIGFSVRGWRFGTERAVPDSLKRVADTLHNHFGLLFVPAGAGVIANLHRLAADGLALLLAILISTALTIAVTGMITSWRSRAARSSDEGIAG